MILFIDSTDFTNVMYGLAKETGLVQRSYIVDPHKSHETLEQLDKFLKSADVDVKLIKKIYVNSGPGSYTGTRVGVTHALALGLGWNIPVKALEKEKFLNELKKHPAAR